MYEKTTKIPYNPSENAHKQKINNEFACKTGPVQAGTYGTCIASAKPKTWHRSGRMDEPMLLDAFGVGEQHGWCGTEFESPSYPVPVDPQTLIV